MSIPAINYVLRLSIGRSTEKFLLLCLANYADEHGYCYPSQKRLSEDTDMDRKTIISGLSSLAAAGHISDTGQRVGSTKQVIVYQIVGIPEACKTHYTYKITCPVSGQFYLGKRSFNGNPEHDVYRGSCEWVRLKQKAKDVLIREVLGIYETERDALLAEAKLFVENDGNPLCVNLGLPSRQRERSIKSAENGTVPFFPPNSPVFPAEQSRKRDTEPSVEPPLNLNTHTQGEPRGRGKHELPKDFTPNASSIGLCTRLGVDPAAVLEELREWAARDRPKYFDWQATFCGSARRAAQSGKRWGGSKQPVYGREPRGVVAAALRAAARYSTKDETLL